MSTIREICPDAATEPAKLQSLRDDDTTECPICYRPYAELLDAPDDTQSNTDPQTPTTCTDPITLQACNHTYCTDCLTTWFREAPTADISCPLCRTKLGRKMLPPPSLHRSMRSYFLANFRMERFVVRYDRAAGRRTAVTAPFVDDDDANNMIITSPSMVRFTAQDIYNAGGGLLSLTTNTLDNIPAGPIRLPVYGSPRFLRFVASIPTAALNIVRELTPSATPAPLPQLRAVPGLARPVPLPPVLTPGVVVGGGPPPLSVPQLEPAAGPWQVIATTSVTDLRTLLLRKLFTLYVERFGGDNINNVGELPGRVVSDWQRYVDVVLREALLADGGGTTLTETERLSRLLREDPVLKEVDRFVRMLIGVIIRVDNPNGSFRAALHDVVEAPAA